MINKYMNEETQKQIKNLVDNWDLVKSKYILKQKYGSERETLIGNLWWDNPNLIFVLVTDKEEDYKGSQAQIGIDKEGKIRWEYQSHCSCNGYEDSSELGEEFTPALSRKSYELNAIPEDWEKQIQENIGKLLSSVK